MTPTALNNNVNVWNEEDIKICKQMLLDGYKYAEIGKRLNRTTKSVKLKLNRMGIYYPEKIIVDKFCECCGDKIHNAGKRFCSTSCAAKINNVLYPKRSPLSVDKDGNLKRIRLPKLPSKCLNCGDNCYKKYCNNDCQSKYKNRILLENWKGGLDVGYSGKTKQLKSFIKRYLHEKYNYKCSKCGWDKIHDITNKCPLEVNHIDGDAENCKEENLEVICPNCHSLTHNFRALNSNSKRIRN